MGFEKGVCSLLAVVSQQGFHQCLHGHLRAVSREVRQFLYCLSGVCGPWQCGRAILKGVVEVVVPHGFCLLDPGIREFRCVWNVRRPRARPTGRPLSLRQRWLVGVAATFVGVLGVYFWGKGLGRHQDPVRPEEDPPLGVCFEDVDVEGIPQCDGYFHSGGVEMRGGGAAEELIDLEEGDGVFRALQWWGIPGMVVGSQWCLWAARV